AHIWRMGARASSTGLRALPMMPAAAPTNVPSCCTTGISEPCRLVKSSLKILAATVTPAISGSKMAPRDAPRWSIARGNSSSAHGCVANGVLGHVHRLAGGSLGGLVAADQRLTVEPLALVLLGLLLGVLRRLGRVLLPLQGLRSAFNRRGQPLIRGLHQGDTG